MHADASSSFIATAAAAAAAAAAEVPIYYWIMMSHAEPAVIRPPFNIYMLHTVPEIAQYRNCASIVTQYRYC